MIIWTLATGDEVSLENQLIKLASSLLSEEELARAQRFHFEADRNRFVLAHALCRIVLSSQSENEPSFWEFDREPLGRPYVCNSLLPVDFNLSHTKGVVGCALSTDGRIGLDLEFRQRSANIEELADKKFAPGEARDILSLHGQKQRDQFFRYWTLKEAYIKVTGRGLREPLDSFCFDLSGSNPRCQIDGQHLDQYAFGLFPVGETHQGAWAINLSDRRGQIPVIRHLGLEEFRDMLI